MNRKWIKLVDTKVRQCLERQEDCKRAKQLNVQPEKLICKAACNSHCGSGRGMASLSPFTCPCMLGASISWEEMKGLPSIKSDSPRQFQAVRMGFGLSLRSYPVFITLCNFRIQIVMASLPHWMTVPRAVLALFIYGQSNLFLFQLLGISCVECPSHNTAHKLF